MMDWLGLAAMITACTGVFALVLTAISSRKKNTRENAANRDAIVEGFFDLKRTVMDHHDETRVKLNSLATNQEVLFGMIADVDDRTAAIAQQVAGLGDKGKRTTVVRSRDMVGVK